MWGQLLLRRSPPPWRLSKLRVSHPGNQGFLIPRISQSLPRMHLMSKPTPKALEMMRLEDGVASPDYVLVYRSSIARYSYYGYHFCNLLLLVISAGVGAYLYQRNASGSKELQFPINIRKSMAVRNTTEVAIMFASLMLSLIACRNVCRKYPLRIYFNPRTKSHKVAFVGVNPLYPRSVEIPPKSVQRRKFAISMLPEHEFRFGRTKIALLPDEFRTPADYCRFVEK